MSDVREFSCQDCLFDPDGSLVMCAKHDRMLKPLSIETLRLTFIDNAAHIDALESRCADKDASIAQLIEQLQKAEASANAENATPSADQDIADHTKWADIKTERAFTGHQRGQSVADLALVAVTLFLIPGAILFDLVRKAIRVWRSYQNAQSAHEDVKP